MQVESQANVRSAIKTQQMQYISTVEKFVSDHFMST